MVKASLLTLICGLTATKLPFWISYPALYILPVLEICYMAVHHQDFAIHRAGLGYLTLLFLGLTSFYAATLFLFAERRASE